MEALLDRRATMIVTSYVLLETLALLQSRVGLDAARQFDHAFRPQLEVRWVDEGLHERAFRRLEIRGAKRVSLADCTSFVVMEEIGVSSAFAFGRHFEEEGFRLLRCVEDVEP